MAVTAVYCVRPDLENFLSITSDESDIARLVQADAFKGRSMLSWWVPLDVSLQEWYGDDRHRSLGDFVHFLSGSLVLGPRALEALEPVLAGRGEVLPLRSGMSLAAWNCTNVVDAVDEATTQGVKYPSGSAYMKISHYALRAEAVDDEPIFKIPERVGSDIFVSDAVTNVIEDRQLGGLRLVPVELT